MANTIKTWYAVVQKIFSITSVVLSLGVVVSTVYTLTKVNTKQNNEESKNSSTEMTFSHTSKKFRSVINICSAICLGCAFIQCTVSFRSLISCSKKFGVGMKLYLSVHFAAFLLYLAAIIVPLVYYDGDHDSILNPKYLEVIFSKENVTHFLNAYFATIIANDGFLLVFLLVTCICLKRGRVENGELDDQKQKLLSAESNELYKY